MPVVKRLGLALAFVAIFGCSRSAGVTNDAVPQAQSISPVAAARPDSASSLTSAGPGPSNGSQDHLYIANAGNGSITVYRHDASADTPPLRVIAGPKTGLDSYIGTISQDSDGNLYVTDYASVLVFSRNASGNVAPIRRVSGPATTITFAYAATVDKKTNELYVAACHGGGCNGAEGVLLRFAQGANGNVAPLGNSGGGKNAGVPPATELASDSTGNNLIVSHQFPCCTSVLEGISTYSKVFDKNSQPEPYAIIGFANANGVADDATTHTYLASNYELPEGVPRGIYRFAEDTTGIMPWNGQPESLNHRPVSIITSDTCGSQLAVAPGPTPYTYVTHSTRPLSGGCPNDAVYVYANDASGDAKPVRILSGPATLLDMPSGIAEGL